jgi:hypothetical protein
MFPRNDASKPGIGSSEFAPSNWDIAS